MEIYECEMCGKWVEIEKWEALMGHDEPYEFGQCTDCFEIGINEDNTNT